MNELIGNITFQLLILSFSVLLLLMSIISLPSVKKRVYRFLSKFRFFPVLDEINKEGLQGSRLFNLKKKKIRIFFLVCFLYLVSFYFLMETIRDFLPKAFYWIFGVIYFFTAVYVVIIGSIKLYKLLNPEENTTKQHLGSDEFNKIFKCIKKHNLTSYQKTWEALNNQSLSKEDRTILGKLIEKLNQADEKFKNEFFNDVSKQISIENFVKKLS